MDTKWATFNEWVVRNLFPLGLTIILMVGLVIFATARRKILGEVEPYYEYDVGNDLSVVYTKDYPYSFNDKTITPDKITESQLMSYKNWAKTNETGKEVKRKIAVTLTETIEKNRDEMLKYMSNIPTINNRFGYYFKLSNGKIYSSSSDFSAGMTQGEIKKLLKTKSVSPIYNFTDTFNGEVKNLDLFDTENGVGIGINEVYQGLTNKQDESRHYRICWAGDC
ncbi:MAG: hypothetical protein LBM95_09465 [Lactobacillales bacterium]|nr:hypothetical protein [Lactobacillales bacterium]